MSVSVCLSVCLSVTEVHWRIIANLGFKFLPTLPRIAAAVLLAGGSSRAMLASARLSCSVVFDRRYIQNRIHKYGLQIILSIRLFLYNSLHFLCSKLFRQARLVKWETVFAVTI